MLYQPRAVAVRVALALCESGRYALLNDSPARLARQPTHRTQVNRTSLLPYLWMLLGSVAFALMGTLAHALSERADWQFVAMIRSVVPLAIMLGLCLGSGVRLAFLRPGVLWLRSIAGSCSMLCTFYALSCLPTADVFTLTNTFPLWVALLSGPLLGEKPPVSVWLAMLCGVAGVAVILQPHFAAGNLGAVAALCAAFFTALAMIGLHRVRDIDARAIVAHFSGVALLFNLAAFLLLERKHDVQALDGIGLAMILGVGVTATIGQLLLTRAFSDGSPARVSVVGLMQIPFTLFWDLLIFRHPLQPWTLLGMPLVMLPAAWLMLKPPPVAMPEEPEETPAEELVGASDT